MRVVLLWREEACTPTGIYTFNPLDPFDGVEVYEILTPLHPETDSELEDRLAKLAAEHDGRWKFHIESYNKA